MNGLLSRLVQSDQAANELTEEQVPNFLINIPDEQIDIELGENTDIDSEDISSTSSHSRSVSASNPRFSYRRTEIRKHRPTKTPDGTWIFHLRFPRQFCPTVSVSIVITHFVTPREHAERVIFSRRSRRFRPPGGPPSRSRRRHVVNRE